MSADLYFTGVLSLFLSFFLSFFFFRGLISEHAENACPKIWGIPLQILAQNHVFGRLRNLTATLVAYIFRMKHDVDNRSSALTSIRGLLSSQNANFTHPV